MKAKKICSQTTESRLTADFYLFFENQILSFRRVSTMFSLRSLPVE